MAAVIESIETTAWGINKPSTPNTDLNRKSAPAIVAIAYFVIIRNPNFLKNLWNIDRILLQMK
jgi:hypothetical protein